MSDVLPLELDGAVYRAGGRRLLGALDLCIDAAGITVVLGPNGSGKSLTLRLANGLLAPSEGTVRWNGASPESARRRQVLVFERPVLLRRSTLANVVHALALHGVPRAEREERARRALERTGLAELAGRSARVLSAGEQQRLALARAWALGPEVLLLDEPTAALDPAATRQVESLIASMAGEGTKVIMSTHDLAQARRLADEVVFLVAGRLSARAAADDFFANPGSAEARAFLEGKLLA